MADMRYIENEEGFLPYVEDVFATYFTPPRTVREFYDRLPDKHSKNACLRLAGVYKFLVRDGVHRITDPQFSADVDYLDHTPKFVAIFSLIEAIESEAGDFLDFGAWIGKQACGLFPIDNMEEFNDLYRIYKEQHGARRKVLGFFERLDDETRNFIQQRMEINGRRKSIRQLADRLYKIRSEYVHRAELIAEFGDALTVSVRSGETYVVGLSLEELMLIFERGLLLRFGFRGRLPPLPERQVM